MKRRAAVGLRAMTIDREDGLPPPPDGMMYVPEKPSLPFGGEGDRQPQDRQQAYSDYRERWFEAINGRAVVAEGSHKMGRPR